ncbi:MAG: alpha-L-arabinofuranosidase [Bacteroidales bacterium]|nr:alpha-L-arabinofuranosidase [Bacteroidales bacterium]
MMKKRALMIMLPIICLTGCGVQDGDDFKPATGVIKNPSVEVVESSTVTGWVTNDRFREAVHFYDNIAHHGTKSLFIDAPGFAEGAWFSRVLLKPWSEYRFSGWIRTRGVIASDGRGAGFNIRGMDVELKGYTGDNEWTKVTYQFSTGGNDGATIECRLNLDGKAKGRVWFDDMSLELVKEEKISTSLKIDVTKRSEPMPVYIYGQFIEHLGRCIYGGIWSEMVEDRKFWYKPGEQDSPWLKEGDDKFFSVDTSDPFIGTNTPVITTDGSSEASLIQKGLGIRAGINVVGHIVLKASGNKMSADVSLSWGTETNESIKVSLEDLNPAYKSYPLDFKIPVTAKDVTLTITTKGRGKVWVGTVSLMPSDNIEGFRADVLAFLRELNSPVYRWPGGNFVSGYNWMDGIGDRDKRPPRKNPAWLGVEHNDVGIHEFMRFCELINTEPYIAVNAGLGDHTMARQEVEYCNGSADTPMGRLRSANGHPDPWKVKWWSIGNEMYGSWQLGHMPTEEFVKKHNAFVDVMRSVDPEIKIIAVGDLGDWDRMVLSNCADKMDFISEHFYRGEANGGGLMSHVRQVPDAIREKAEAHRAYRKEIRALDGRDIRICMDEWNYWYGPHIYGELGTRYFMRDAMGIAAGFNEFSKHTDIIYMANYAQTVNVIGAIKTSTTDAVLDATGMVMKLYRKRFGVIPVEVSGEIRPLDVAATLSSGEDTLTLSVVNPTYDEIKIPYELNGAGIGGNMTQWSVTGVDEMSTNEPGQEPNVNIEGPELLKSSSILTVKPVSISIFAIPLR